MSSSRSCSHRNSVQNAPIESSTALTVTLFMKTQKIDHDPKKCRHHKVVRAEILCRMVKSRAPQLSRRPFSWKIQRGSANRKAESANRGRCNSEVRQARTAKKVRRFSYEPDDPPVNYDIARYRVLREKICCIVLARNTCFPIVFVKYKLQERSTDSIPQGNASRCNPQCELRLERDLHIFS